VTSFRTPDRDIGNQARSTPDGELAELADLVYRRYAVPLLSFCLKLTGGDRLWAEDVVQETMLRVWRHAGSLAGDPSDLMP
jgi:RNA polymerase sigma-70 factor, ECF subfamily